MRRPATIAILIALLSVLGCTDDDAESITTTTTTTTGSGTDPGDSTQPCPADGLLGPDGKTYGRDARQGCQFVDENGIVVGG